MSATTYYAVKDDIPVRARPYAPVAISKYLKKGAAVTVVGSGKNSQNNLWYKLNDGNWIFNENLTKNNPNQSNNNNVNGSYKLDGYDCNKVEKNMTVNVGAGYTLRFARSVSATSNDYTAIPNGKTVYVYGTTVNKYKNKSGDDITWAKIRYDNKDGWVNLKHLK